MVIILWRTRIPAQDDDDGKLPDKADSTELLAELIQWELKWTDTGLSNSPWLVSPTLAKISHNTVRTH